MKMPASLASSFLSRMGSRSTLSKEYKATVQLLDDNETLTVDFKKGDTGQVIFDYVCECLNIVEKDYFGLRYMDNLKNRYWLDPAKPIFRQIKGVSGIVLRFRVKYYPREPALLKEEITRYQLFLQLRRDLLHGRLYAPAADAAALGAAIVQSELGAFDAAEHPDGYVSEYKLFLKQTAKLEERIAAAHAQLGDINPAQAELAFLRRAAALDTYGYDPYTVKDGKGAQLYVGVTHQGILVYQFNRKMHHINWDDLDKIDYLGKDLIVTPKPAYFARLSAGAVTASPSEEGGSPKSATPEPEANGTVQEDHEEEDENAEPNTNGDVKEPIKKEKGELRYTCSSGTFSKHLWKYTLSQQAFFTKDTKADVKEVHSKARIPLFARGSTFRFTGRVLHEIQEEAIPGRDEPSFVRYHLERQPSRNERGFPWMSKYSTLPRLRPKPAGEDDLAPRSQEAPDSLADAVAARPPSPDDPRLTLGGTSPLHDASPVDDVRHSASFNAAPQAFSTPLKAPAPETELRQRKASAAKTNGTTPKSETPTAESGGGGCRRMLGCLLSGLLVTMLVVGVVVAVMEISEQDPQWRRTAHSVPGLEAFRYKAYAPVRSYTMGMYRKLMGE